MNPEHFIKEDDAAADRRSAPRRRGSLLIELAVVTLIAAVLGALMLPALLRTRDAARRTGCLNNLHNLTLAVHNYEALWDALPPGGGGPPGVEPLGWLPRVAGELDAWQLVAGMDLNAGADAATNTAAATTQIAVLVCPADDSGAAPATSNYAGISGGRDVPLGPTNGGVFVLGRSVRRSEILDGAGHTLFIGEKPIGGPAGGGNWLQGDASTLRTTAAPPNARGPNRPAPGVLGPGGLASAHGSGINAAFGDGGVRWVRDDVSPAVMRRWGERADGELPGGGLPGGQ